MSVKNKTLRRILAAALGLLCLYFGICCGTSLVQAGTQPYLLDGTRRLNFLGYPLMAAVYGGVCLLLGLLTAGVLHRGEK